MERPLVLINSRRLIYSRRTGVTILDLSHSSLALLKFSKKMFKTGIEKFVKLDVIIPKNQLGFFKDRSCEMLSIDKFRNI